MIPIAIVVLRELEWSSFSEGPGSGPHASGGDGAWIPSCPSCRGIKPDHPGRTSFIESAWGHRSDCRLDQALKEAAGEWPAEQETDVRRRLEDAEQSVENLRDHNRALADDLKRWVSSIEDWERLLS